MSKDCGLSGKGISFGFACGMLFVFILVFAFSWHIKSELYNLYILGNELSKQIDINKTLEALISENKLISAREFFGFYVSYYNNYIIILSCIIAAFSIVSFFYFRSKNEETNQKIEGMIQEQVNSFLSNKINIEKEIQSITERSIIDLIDRIEKLEGIVENIQNLYESQNAEIDKELIKPIERE